AERAVWAVGKVGPEARDAVPALIEAVKGNNGSTRREAARALRRIGPDARAAVPALVEHLAGYGNIREEVIKALVQFGQEAPQEVVPPLIGVLTKPGEERIDWDDNPQFGAAEVLTQLGPRGKDAASALRSRLADTHTHPYLRVAVAEALWRVEEKPEPAVEALRAVLRDGNGSYTIGVMPPRGKAAEALGRIGPEAKAAVPEVEKLLKEGEPLGKLAAAEALWRVDGRTQDTVPGLVTLLKRRDLRPNRVGRYISESEHRQQIAEILGRIGPAAKEAVPALLDAIKEEDAENAKRSIWLQPIEHDEEDEKPDRYTPVRRA